MRILVLHNRYRPVAPSGENAVVDQESAALRAAGHDVHLVQRHSADIEGWSRARRATLPARMLWSRESQRLLADEVARFGPDVVHVHNTFPLLTPAVLQTCVQARVPVVATVHNYKLACANGELFRDGATCHECLPSPSSAGGMVAGLPGVRHGCYRSSRSASLAVVAATAVHARAWRELVSAYVFISAAQRNILAPLGLPPERCFVKHNFVAAPRAADAPPAGSHRVRPATVAFVGRLDAAKGAPQLMAAWDAFRVRRPQTGLRLVVAGGGPLAGQVQDWARGRDDVDLVGLVSRAEASTVLAGARAAVVPSAWEETFGLVAVEAMAAGTPAIVAGHGALPELVTDGHDGAHFPPGDVAALADLFADVEDAPARWAAMGRRARGTYLARFTQTDNVERLLDIYRYAIEHPIEWSPPHAVSPAPVARRIDR